MPTQPTDEQLKEIKAQHPRAQLLEFADEGVHIVIRPPTLAESKRWKEETRREDTRTIAGSNLAKACIVFPPRAELVSIEAEFPLLIDAVAGEVVDLAGAKAPTKKAL